MKKRIFYAAFLAILLLVAGLLWWNAPVFFLREAAAEKIASIEVFDGNTGNSFTIRDPYFITQITENIRQRPFKKERLSLFFVGSAFRLSFYDEDGNLLEALTVNSANTIRQDPFFYFDEQQGLCFDLLCHLEEQSA